MRQIIEDKLISSGGLPPEDFSNDIERIAEVAQYELLFDANVFEKVLLETSTMAVSEATLKSIVTAIQAGNIVLQGPPGTGKSSLARAVAKAFNVATTLVTAHDD